MLHEKLTNFNRSHFFIVLSYAFAKLVGDEQVWDRTSRETKRRGAAGQKIIFY
jgi:hypothetical protein